jgi:hypothetical protein
MRIMTKNSAVELLCWLSLIDVCLSVWTLLFRDKKNRD